MGYQAYLHDQPVMPHETFRMSSDYDWWAWEGKEQKGKPVKGEWFRMYWGMIMVDVDKAKAIIRDNPRPIHYQILTERMLGPVIPKRPEWREVERDGRKMKALVGDLMTSAHADWEYIDAHPDEIDERFPIIIVRIPDGKLSDGTPMQGHPQIVDGHHRLAKAWDMGLRIIPMVMIEGEEAEAVCQWRT